GRGEPGQKYTHVSGVGPTAITVRLTLLDYYIMGGPFLHPIAILGFLTIVLAINCAMVYRRQRQCPAKFVEAAEQALDDGDIEKFEELALKERGLLPHICRALADRWNTSTVRDIRER